MNAPLRYGRLRLDGDLDDLHRALAYLQVDTCEKGRCDPGGQCGKHTQRAQRRHLRAVQNREAS
jgi:hypothetical protein